MHPVFEQQNSLFLTREEIFGLTHKKLSNAQVQALRHMGVEHKIRPDGSPAVLRQHIIQLLAAQEPSFKKKSVEPNWEAFNAEKA